MLTDFSHTLKSSSFNGAVDGTFHQTSSIKLTSVSYLSIGRPVHIYPRTTFHVCQSIVEATQMVSSLTILTTFVPFALAAVLPSPRADNPVGLAGTGHFHAGELDRANLISSPVAYASEISSPITTPESNVKLSIGGEPDAESLAAVRLLADHEKDTDTDHDISDEIVPLEDHEHTGFPADLYSQPLQYLRPEVSSRTRRAVDPNVASILPAIRDANPNANPTRLSDQECRLLKFYHKKAEDEKRSAEVGAIRRRQLAGGCGDRL